MIVFDNGGNSVAAAGGEDGSDDGSGASTGADDPSNVTEFETGVCGSSSIGDG